MVRVLLQLKVNRLCLVVDGTAGFDPERTYQPPRLRQWIVTFIGGGLTVAFGAFSRGADNDKLTTINANTSTS